MLRLVRALRHRDYRLFFIGQGLSLVGTWMQRVAFAWLVYRLTGSALMLGLVSFFGQIPTLVLSPWAGVLLDRLDRRRTLLLTQSVAMAQAFTLAALVLGGALPAGRLVLLALVLGVIDAFDAPARQSLLPALLRERADLINAVALNSLLVNGARLIGPVAAGLIVATAGEAACFVVNGLSFSAVIVALLLMRVAPSAAPGRAPLATQLREGLSYAWSVRPIRLVLLLLALVSLLGTSYVVLLPVLAREVLGGGVRTLGLLAAATGGGAAAGALYLASRQGAVDLPRVAGGAAACFGLGLTALAQTTWLPGALAVLAVVGCGLMVCTGAINTALQTLVAEEQRGRVMGLYSTAFAGMLPLGALLAGQLASTLGPAATLALCGGGCAAGALVFLAAAAPRHERPFASARGRARSFRPRPRSRRAAG